MQEELEKLILAAQRLICPQSSDPATQASKEIGTRLNATSTAASQKVAPL